MDLSLSPDLDSSLLNWSEAVADMSAAVASPAKNGAPSTTTSQTEKGNGAATRAGDGMGPPGFMRLPSFHLEQERQAAAAPSSSEHRKGMTNVETLATRGMPAPASKAVAAAPSNAWANPQFNLAPHLYSQLMSTAALPEGSSCAGPAATPLPQHLVFHPFMPVMAQAGTVPNHTLAAASAAYMGTLPAPMAPAKNTAPQQAQMSSTSQQMTDVTAVQRRDAPPAQQQASSLPPAQHAARSPQVHPQSCTARPQGNTYVPIMFNPMVGAVNGGYMPTMPQHQVAAAPATAPNQGPTSAPTNQVVAAATKPTTASNNNPDASSSQPTETPPPFLLFDAPCELRTNFIQSQRMHGIPVSEDNNSYHYGMAVNGFHPQVNAQDNPILPLSSSTTMSHNGVPIQLVDGRHHKSKRGGARERNEREQKRAQKITELIETLRVSIEKGGWRVEVKSKYHTLTTCADYVKHLIKTTQEKEAAVEQAKLDLTVRECKLAEDNAQLESRSDPESVASSLTESTMGSDQEKRDDQENGAEKVSSPEGKKRHKDGSGDAKPAAKKVRLAEVSQSTDSSSGEEGGSGGPGGKNISLNQMSSSVSEMTDSNADGENRKSAEGEQSGTNEIHSSTSSISSTAVVVRGEGSSDRPHGHADVVIKKKRSHGKRKRQEFTSLEPNFELDYQDVFLSSNVPQLIATPTGKIVVWNDFFLKATGLTKEEAEGMTIFSIVEADKLSSLFEMIGQALKRDSSCRDQNDVSTSKVDNKGESTESSTDRVGDYMALTLPCIKFPASKKRRAVASSHHPNPLYMTVTLMGDEDPRKRCFHCVLTDCPLTKGAPGSVTPELLALLYAEPDCD